jgi:hypothetical protein
VNPSDTSTRGNVALVWRFPVGFAAIAAPFGAELRRAASSASSAWRFASMRMCE